MIATVAAARAALDSGRTSSRALVQTALDRIADPAGEGVRTFLKVHRDQALAAAAAADTLRAAGLAPVSPLAGLPVSIKDLLDVAGEVTTTGSRVLANDPPASRDARVVARLRRAGAAIVGRTNQSEFAFHGTGLNPHFGTPKNPWDRATGRIPGGSSSGAAISVTDGMAIAAVGTDTGGSIRLPAALCGIVGFKPTAVRVPQDGCYPLSRVLDSIGPLAGTVADCLAMDRVLAGIDPDAPLPVARPSATISLFVPTNLVFDDVDRRVARAFDAAIGRLASAGVRIVSGPLPALERIREMTDLGGFSSVETAHTLARIVAEHGAEVDPFVVMRIRRGEGASAGTWLQLQDLRAAYMREVWGAVGAFTALAFPASPYVAPTIAELEADIDRRARINAVMLRNTMIGNNLDCCGISMPCHVPGDAPVGFMLTAAPGRDDDLFAAALTLEPLVAGR
jgi:aspartyl-tRNA(Asn)/glutamyl-tRNA(Gln) amidotransferase subunit A